MRALFHLPYPGYHRLYASTVVALATRGNEVLLSYDSDKHRSEVVDSVEATPGVRVVEPVPRREGPLATLASQLRIGADYLRYLDPRYGSASWLRERMEPYLPDELSSLKNAQTLDQDQSDAIMEFLRELEGSIPSDPGIEAYLAGLGVDCAIVSPVLARGRSGVHQRETVKSAKALGLPVAVAVASWDHLTSKGVIGEMPDEVYVWNKAQRAEAMRLHQVPKERIVITGAQLFDHWFELEPEMPREEFVGGLGLDPGRPYLLYVGSSPNITPVEREREVVRRWIGSLRKSGSSRIREVGVLIRPHPGNVAGWSDVDFSDLDDVAISPRIRPNIVMNRDEELHYFRSLYFSSAVVGVNTSAMIEAAIVGRPIHAIPDPEFEPSREGTLHFHLLTPDSGGCVRVAENYDQHIGQLEESLTNPESAEAELREFVTSFVRPNGLERPATRVLAKAIERLPRRSPELSPL